MTTPHRVFGEYRRIRKQEHTERASYFLYGAAVALNTTAQQLVHEMKDNDLREFQRRANSVNVPRDLDSWNQAWEAMHGTSDAL